MRCFVAVIFITVVAGPLAAQTPALREADAHFQAGRWTEAERAYRAILQTDSTSSMAWYRLGRLYLEVKNDPARATLHFEGAVRHGFQPLFIPRFGMARAAVLLGRADSALTILEQIAGLGLSQPEAVTADTILVRLAGSPRYDALIERIRRNAQPCEHSVEARQFDFWIGTWDVVALNGVPQGTNRIEKILRGCALMENWIGGGGREGKSLNFFDPQRKTWRQVWVADANSILDYREGVYSDGVMTFSGVTIDAKGDTTLQKLTFKRIHADTVHQIFEASADRGQSWKQTWMGIYVRRKGISGTRTGTGTRTG